ncbi:SNF2 family amine-terminal domain protein (macronuclear) [Tetrahymena thermophila SB210]|uniref:SNF2 family amine-terminal domain protein n=1 Tax=Tetrahymena thermophila (strain SB210) TaxID=312017 RepID=Q22KF3_TETTS|nr:SNF2 family amine-terminal domain protein [Tetrahymena thermophila SB210]EAR85846.2 SNF2 family amine-terminal domain protein [Tetrahymena thermophila SB210]|eukprot:XP_001033509.2 SNF2 family amine-terminal domain protein [Tetrahymena thermophila SB210]
MSQDQFQFNEQRPRKRKLRSIADEKSLSNYLGSFKSELILGNVEMIVNKEQLFAVKESKWNFINDIKLASNYINLENSGKLKKEDVKVNLMEELMKNPCNQDVLVSYGNPQEKKYCLLRHKFSEMWRFPIYCSFLELRIEVCDDEDLVENRLFQSINSQMQQTRNSMENENLKDLVKNFQKNPKQNVDEIIAVNKFRNLMKQNIANASKVMCNVHIYLKQHFYTFPLHIHKGVLEKGCTNFSECSINEQIELLSKDSLYLLFSMLNLNKLNQLDIPLSKKIPIMSQYYKMKSKKNILDSQRMNISLTNSTQKKQTAENEKQSEIYMLLDDKFLESIECSGLNVDDDFLQSKDTVRQSESRDNSREDTDDSENLDLQEYDDESEDEHIYENEEEDADTKEEDRNNIEEGKNFKKTPTPSQMLKQFELKEYQQQGLTWMLHREQKLSKKKLYEQKWQILSTNNQFKDITMAYEQYLVENPYNEENVQFYYNPLNGHSCLDIEFEEDEEPVQGGILADQMGLGKTIQAIALLLQSKFKDYLNESDTKNQNVKQKKPKNVRKFYLKNEDSDDSYRGTEDELDDEDKYSDDEDSDQEITLIIAPKSLVNQWRLEIQATLKDIESLQIYQYEKGQKYSKKKKLFKGIDIVITTYGTLSAEYMSIKKGKIQKGNLLNQKWERVILDEAHLIRNRNTQISQACCELNSKFRWCLTGTPLQNKIEDLFGYFRFLKVPQIGEWRWWSDYISKSRNKEKTYQFIKAVLKGMMLRRTKTTKDQEGKPIIVLPQKIINVDNISFNKFEGELYTIYFSNQQKLFAGLLDQYEQERSQRGRLHEQMFVMVNNLRMMCNNFQMVKLFQDSNLEKLRKIIIELKKENKKEAANPNKQKWDEKFLRMDYPGLTDEQIQEKLAQMNQSQSQNFNEGDDEEEQQQIDYKKLAKTDRVVDIIEQVQKKGEKILLFTQWHDSIQRLKKRFEDLDIGYCELHGKMTIKQRAKQVHDFYRLPSKTVMVLSLMAGCVGLNLTCANNVIIMDPWWNGAIEDQAVDRVYRIGQKKDVNVYRCLIKHDDSIDLRISELCKKKEALCNKILSLSQDERSISQNLTIEDFKFLFGLSNPNVPSQIDPNFNQDLNNSNGIFASKTQNLNQMVQSKNDIQQNFQRSSNRFISNLTQSVTISGEKNLNTSGNKLMNSIRQSSSNSNTKEFIIKDSQQNTSSIYPLFQPAQQLQRSETLFAQPNVFGKQQSGDFKNNINNYTDQAFKINNVDASITKPLFSREAVAYGNQNEKPQNVFQNQYYGDDEDYFYESSRKQRSRLSRNRISQNTNFNQNPQKQFRAEDKL